MDAGLAFGIASLEQMQRIQDDTWQGASTDSDDEIDDSVLANLQLPTSTDSTLGGVDPPEARLDALWAIGIASLEQMQRIQDDTWQGASTDSGDEIDDSVLANLQLPQWGHGSRLDSGLLFLFKRLCPSCWLSRWLLLLAQCRALLLFANSELSALAQPMDAPLCTRFVLSFDYHLIRSCPHWLSRWLLRFA